MSDVRNALSKSPGPAKINACPIVFLKVCTSITNALSNISVGRKMMSMK